MYCLHQFDIILCMIGTVNTSEGGLYTLAPPEWCCTYMKRGKKKKLKKKKKKS